MFLCDSNTIKNGSKTFQHGVFCFLCFPLECIFLQSQKKCAVWVVILPLLSGGKPAKPRGGKLPGAGKPLPHGGKPLPCRGKFPKQKEIE